MGFKELSTSRRYELSEIARHGWHNNYYQLNLDIQELDKSTVTIDKMGSIRSDSDFEFKAKVLKDNPVNSKETASKLVNHGLINIKGTFKSDAAQLINQMKYFEQNALEGVFKNKANINIYYKPSARFILTPLSGQAHRKFESLESFLDALFGPSPITKSGIYSAENFSAYKLLSHVKHSPMFQKSMAQVFGAEWHRLSYDDMSKRWKEFKEKPTSFIYYPEEKAKILAGKIEANGTTLQNGEYSQYDTFDGSINIGKHALTLPKVEFRPEISSKEIFDQGLVDLSALADILDPNLFIDNSVQLEKQGIDINKEDLDLIDKKEIDYLDPDEIVNNGRLLDELLTDLGEDEYIDDDKFYDNRRKNNERFESLPRDLQRKLHELFAKRKEERNAKRLELLEKARIAKEKEQKERNENYKEEEKRLEIDKSIKEKELADQVNKERLIREIEAKREVEIAQKEARKKEELRLAEEKRKQEQAKKAEEKKVEEERIEEEKQLSKEQFRQEEDISKKILLKVVDDNRPKVETDPLYRTKLKYINQDEYVGANHFFNNITTDATQNNPDTKVSVLGDNYFEHQLITRTIEKKVDNQLEQKYKASGVELVKKLMENSTSEAKELGLKVGEVLTKEQQAKLKQDIVWYVKTKINGKDVFVPQVYFAPQTLANAEKAKGLGTAVINASELNIKAENVVNNSTLSGDKIKVEASEKIQNKGSIISTEETRLVGHKGIENLSRSFANNELGVDVQRSEIKTDGHLHLETDLDAKVDVQASDIKAKTGFVKTGELNLKDTYKTKHSYDAKFSNESSFSKKLKDAPLATILNPVELLSSALNFSSKSHSESHHQANSVGSKVSIDQLHVAVEKDVNQVGSELEAKRISGVIKGNYNTEAGKNVKNSEREEYSSHFYASAHASGGGTSVRVDYNSIDGGKASVDVPTTQTGVGADAGLSFNYKKQSETLLTHNNSELQVESGTLHVLGNADIGGVDINNKLPQRTAEKAGTDPVANNTNTANTPAEQSTTASNNKEKSKFNTLSEAEINDLMSEKGKAYFDEQSKTPSTSGFELSAKEIKSTKQKDEYTLESTKNTFKIGPEAEAHSAIADMVSHMVKEFRDVQNGVKQDGTVALQHASDVLNLVTGDLVGTSAKLAVENTRETKSTQETGDIVTKIGGNVTLSARNGSLELKNIQSNADTNLTLKAKENVDILAGEKTRNTTERLSRQKLAAGANAGCSAMTGACTAGVSASIEGNESFTSEHAKMQNNSLLQGQSITIDAGKDLNLVNSNIEANNVDLNVKGNTNIVSKQDTLDKTTHGFDYNVSAGAALSSATIATPTGIIGGGYTNESEHSATVNQQAGIKANKLTGSVNNLNLEAGYIVNNDKSGGFKVTGEVTSKELHDRHDKDGGSFGLSVGINERGTSAFNVRGGRSDQKHYNATQQSTLTGVTVEQSKVSGIVNDDLGKAKNVTRDDTYASTQFSFEVADIVELGKKAKDKIDSHKNKGISDDTPNVSLSKSRLSESDSDSVSVKNPIYDSIEAPTTKVHTSDTDSVTIAPNTRSLKTEDMVDNPLYGSTVATPRSAKPSETVDGPNAKTRVYEEIPLTTSEVTSNQTASTNRTKKVDSGEEHIYAEVGQGTYSTLGDKNANGGRGLRKANDTEGTYNKLGDSVADTTRAKAKVNEEHIYAEVGQGTYSTLGDKSANGGRGFKQVDSVEGIYNTVGDNHSDIVRRNLNNAPEYSESMPKTRRNAQDSLPEVPTTKSRTNLTEASDGIYSEITLKPRSANDPLPDLPKDAQSRVRGDVDFAEHIYEDIGTSRAKRPLPNTPEVKAKAPVSDSDGQYASVNITPRARNPQDALPEAPNTRAKVVVENDGIYSQINDAVTPQPRSKSIKVESDYEAIPLGDFEPKVEQPRSRSRRSIIEETVQVEPKVRSISEEIPSSNSTNKAKAPVAEDVYATLDKTAEGRARANAKADEAVAQNIVNKAKVDDDVPPTLPKRPDNLAVEVESHSATNTGKVIRPENEVAVQSELRNRVNTDGDYAEVVDTKPNPKANRPLPDAPTTQNVAKNRINTDGDYAQIVETAATQSNSKAKRDLPELPNDALVKTRPTFEIEGDYAQIGNNIVNRAPRSQQENNAESVKNLVITEANSNNNSNNQGKKAQAAEIAQATGTAEKSDKSWFSKVKDFFTGGSSKEQAKGKVSKATKVEEQDVQVAAKPRYDDLEDNINLKNLLALEAQRNEAFETNVLKNTKFLDEAREAAKKSIPEATIKQMGNSPEFDDILTDGARKVEKRINDAVTFKPSAEEFSAIQGLVKTLPKGEVIDDVTIKTQSITEALAETSKTIQRNPKLKEEVQGAIEEFLKSSQGKDLTVEMVEKLNHGLRPDEGSDRQLYKKETLTKENAVFSSPEASKIQLSETVDFINRARKQGVEPSVLAGLVYQRLIAYHPFAEGNGRMARVIVNKLLLDAGYPPFTKFNSDFETQIIPQTLKSAKSATSTEVVKEFLTELSKKPLPDVSVQSQAKARAAGNEVTETVGMTLKAQRDLPELPTQPQARKLVVSDSDYAEVAESNQIVQPKVTEKVHTIAEESPTLSTKVKTDEDLYATIDKSPEARAKAKARSDEAEAKNPRVVVAEADEDFAPLLPIRPELKDAAGGHKKAKVKNENAAAEQTEKTSVFQRVKQFFTGSDSSHAKSSKVATKVEEQDVQVAAKPRYDDLEDNINLKNLLALEAQRNEAFETNVLKNTKFLDEAREAAKKSIPEATIKQMGNSPEFDDILTDGARKVEKRINDAVTFKPSAEEFSAIQGLVKTLPKGEVIDDVTIKTQSITEALAETSKTIQRNPKLKEEVQGAIEEFLKSSQGKDLTVEMVEKLNHGLRPDEGSDRQLYKKETLTKENAVFSSPEASKIQLSETVDFINRARKQGVEPSVLAGLVYQRLIAYHPFAEGNGRMARVIVNKLLLDAGYPPFTKFNSDFETQIIPQTLKSAKSATSTEVVKEFLTELSKKPLPEISKTVTDKAKIAVEEPIYATVDKRPEALAKAKARGDEAAAKNANVKATVETDIAPALPARPSELTSTIDNTTKTGKPIVLPKPKLNTSVESENQVNAVTPKAPAKEKPPVAPKPKVKVIVENDADGVARTRVIVQPEVAGESQLRSRTIGNSDYAEIVDGAAQVQPRSKARQSVNSDYAEIIDGIPQIQSPGSVKARSAEDTAIPSNRIKMDDGLYATIDKSPEALARAKARGDEAVAAQSTLRKTQVEDEAPALPKRSTDLVADTTDKQVVLEPKFRSLAVEFDDVNVTQPQAKAKPVSDRIQQKELVEQSRGVLKQVQDQFQPLKVKNKIDAVRSSVEEYGGEVSFKFAQSKGEVYKEIVKHLETQNGVCESTCAHWIAKKVDPQDDNFWTSLYEGGQKGHLKKETIDSIKKLQTEFINSGSATQQFKLTDSWLQEQGVVPKEKRSGNLSRRDEVAGTVSKNDVSALTKAILDTGNETSGVKKISINLEGGSHTVSAAIQGQKVVFFDPNFGEMTFPSHQKFETWLKEAFWNKSGYAGKHEGKRFFNVVNYELPTKAATNNSANVEPVSGVSDVNFKTKTQSNSQDNMADTTTQIRRDQVSGESYITQNDVVTAITNTNYIPKPVTDAKEQFEKAKQKARSVDNTKEAEKKLALIAKEAKNLPKEHLLKATKELVNGISMDDIHAIRQEHKPGAKVVMPSVISEFEGKNVQSMGKIMKNLPFDESYVDTRKQINEKIVEKLDSNKEFHDLMNQKLSGNEAGIRKLFDIVESAKRESLKEVTGIDGKKATLELDTQHSALSLKQGYYANDEVHMNATPLASLFRTKKQNNKEILDTIVHELTHHDQAQIANNRYGKIADAIKPDADLLSLNQKYYIDSDASSFSNYKKQPLEREAFTSGHELSNQLSKLVERGYTGKVQDIQTIEHLPNKLNNLESPRNAQADLGENALIYGLKHGRKELIAKANAADAEGKNAILADSYIGKLNLGFEFAQLSSFAKQVKSGNVTEQDIQDIASFNDPGAKFARKDDSRHRINDANIEDNQRIIKELIKNENAVDALKRIAILSDQEQDMYNALRKNEKFDMEELQESANYTTAENSAIREFKKTQDALNEARMDFFAEKTKLIAKETLERGGQLYFALDGLATDTPNFRNNTKIDLNRLKEVFDPNNPHYDSVTSRELRYLYENYKDHPNLKFTIKDHVIENPLKTLDISSVNGQPSTGEQNVAFNKQLFANPFKAFKQKEKVQGPKIEHLGGNADKDAFYFPLDKIVTKDRGISKDMKVNMENIKKAFNPKDKHYNSTEAKNLRALYEQDPTMSSTRFVIGNQVIENPFKSAELQDYIQKHHVKASVVTAKKAKPLPEVPTEATVNKASALKQPNTAARKPAQQAKPRAQAADPNAIYAQVNKNRVTALDKVDGFYSESQLKTRTDKIVEQVSHVPTTEPTYADLQFSKPARSKHRASDEVVYEEVATKVKGKTPETLAKPQKPKQQLNKGIIPESQLKTRSDKIVEQVSRVPTTEPVYADLQFPASGKQTKQVISSSEETIYAEVGKKSQEEPIYQNVIRKGAK
ncbi:MAG: YopT-type cysteine protease domain-containing protein [Pasteurella oralis]|uniref:YopT-type cysteine protease domain-containing protein n=1 Tax=Pasteurella oralis TaxID=1071947 RepID=UPI0026FFE6F1|nr:YopT-type cysteine protease domain-containing protein [Pasteurella oralis]